MKYLYNFNFGFLKYIAKKIFINNFYTIIIKLIIGFIIKPILAFFIII